MAQRIFKYQLRITDGLQLVSMTPRAPIVHVGTQYDPQSLYFWAYHDDELKDVTRQFVVIGTGHKVPPRSECVGTAQAPPFVWHVLELHP